MKTMLFLGTMLLAGTSFASGKLITCTDLGLFWGDCTWAATTLFAETKSSRRFNIRYKFFCPGHEIDVGFESNNGFRKIRSSSDVQVLELEGRFLRMVDKDPSSTAKSTFDLNCEMEILDKTVSMSDDTATLLKAIKEEGSTISDSAVIFSSLADSLILMRNLHNDIPIEDLLFQRDQLRNILKKIEFNHMPVFVRVSVSANLRVLDEMISHKKSGEILSTQARWLEVAKDMLESIRVQQTQLLDRIAELKLRAIEILVDAEKQNDPSSLEMIAELDRIRLGFRH